MLRPIRTASTRPAAPAARAMAGEEGGRGPWLNEAPAVEFRSENSSSNFTPRRSVGGALNSYPCCSTGGYGYEEPERRIASARARFGWSAASRASGHGVAAPAALAAPQPLVVLVTCPVRWLAGAPGAVGIVGLRSARAVPSPGAASRRRPTVRDRRAQTPGDRLGLPAPPTMTPPTNVKVQVNRGCRRRRDTTDLLARIEEVGGRV